MPFYEYRCSDCSSQFEILRNINQRDEMTDCPQCESTKSTRMISLPMVFSQGSDGQMQAVAGTSSDCGGCTTSSCDGCG